MGNHVDALAEQLEADGPIDRRKLRRRLAYLRRRSHVLDAAVMMGTLGGVATSCAALLLFVGTLRDRPGMSLFVAFGLALLFTMGALVAFLIEMLLAIVGYAIKRTTQLRSERRTNSPGKELAARPWRAGLGISTQDKNVCVCAPRKDWLSVGKGACVWTSACAEALRNNPSPPTIAAIRGSRE